MAQLNDATEKPNGVNVESVGENQDTDKSKPIHMEEEEQQITPEVVIRRLITDILFREWGSGLESAGLLNRIKVSVSQNLALVRDASRNTSRDVVLRTRRGSAFRALLVVSVGTIALLAVTGFLVFTVLFVMATLNAIAISLLISLAAAGGFLALFFACVTAIYISALSIAAFVVSTATISAILAALVVTGWIGFFYTVWLVTKKFIDLAKHSLSITGSAISAYSSSRHAESHYASVSTSD